MRKRKYELWHFSPISNEAWCDLNSKGDILKLHDRCPNSKCKRQTQKTIIPRQYNWKAQDFYPKWPKFSKRLQKFAILF